LKSGLGSTKNIPVKYVPHVLTVVRVRPGVGFTKERYNVRNQQGNVVQKRGRPWDFYASQLVPPHSTSVNLNPQNFNRAMQINNFEDNGNMNNFFKKC
jgi:hypothetical protein